MDGKAIVSQFGMVILQQDRHALIAAIDAAIDAEAEACFKAFRHVVTMRHPALVGDYMRAVENIRRVARKGRRG